MLKSCKICHRIFECYDKKHQGRGRRGIKRKPYNAVTCSRVCSKKNIDFHKEQRILQIRGISAQKRAILGNRCYRCKRLLSGRGRPNLSGYCSSCSTILRREKKMEETRNRKFDTKI
jgi:hypothetical protein